jgi:hypothetical protein
VSVLECAFCENPKLFHADFSDSATTTETVYARGHFWKRIKNEQYPLWPIPAIRRASGDLHSKILIGKDHFASRWRLLTVEVLGYSLADKPQTPPVPLFGMTKITPYGSDATYILWNACKITHEEFSFVVNLHWWPSHGRIFTVEKFDFDSAAARAALSLALSIFGPGRGKPSEYFTNNKQFYEAIKLAVIQRYDAGVAPDDILEIEIAKELFPEADDDARTLRRWLQTSWPKWKWKDIVKSIIEDMTRE